MPHPCNGNPSRRTFCAATCAGVGAGLVLGTLSGCQPAADERVGEGSLDNNGTGTGGNAGGGGGGGGGHAGGGGGGGGGSAGGGGGGGGGAPGGDMAGLPGGDMAGQPSGDMATPPQGCTPGSIAVGAASSYTVGGTAKLFNSGSTKEFYVMRDAGGLYAISSLCTHSGCRNEQQATQWYCRCHGASFALDGSNPKLPATSPLKHYAMCVDATGNATVNTAMTVPVSTRY